MVSTFGNARKRPRSPSAESVQRDAKSLKLSAFESGNCSRRTWILPSDGNEYNVKTLQSSSRDASHVTKADDLGDGSYIKSTPSILLGNLQISNFTISIADKDGNLVPLDIQPPERAPSDVVHGLPTPDPTPSAGNEKPDPFQDPGLLADAKEISVNCTADEIESALSKGNITIFGDIELFGVIPAKIHIHQGLITEAHPYTEIVELSPTKLSISSLVPSLNETPLDSIAIESPRLCYSEVAFDIRKPAGLYLETDVLFQDALQVVSDILKDFFHQTRPALHVTAYLGPYRSWTRPFAPTNLTLSGSLEQISVNILDILEFTEIGVELSFNRRVHYKSLKQDWGLDYGFFGKVNLAVPGSVVPLKVDYYLRHATSAWLLSMRLTDDEWSNIFGIKGLNLSQVRFTAFLSQLSSSSQLSLKIEAILKLNQTSFVISGSYSKDNYSLEAYVGDLTLQDIGRLFQQMTGVDLDAFDHDVVFNSLYLRISSNGLDLSGAITVNGYSSTQGSISISRDGVLISGGIGNIEFEHFTINEAQLDIFIGDKTSKSCARTTKFAITGDLSFSGIDLKVGLFTEKDGDGEPKWTVYGEAAGEMRTTDLVEELEGTFLDISLKGLALIASNHDSPNGTHNVMNYPIAKGIQFCAVIDSIPELESLMRGSVKGMVLRAGYTSGKFSLGIMLPGERTISFGDNVYTGPLELEIQTGKDVKLALKACLNLKANTHPEPYRFALELSAGMLGASAYATMLTDWVNPCNVGKNVKISGCTLGFGIVYTTFFTTGMPGEIGLAGQLNIGKKEAKVAMKLSQNPAEQLLAASVKDLGIVDLVNFASAVADHDFPVPDNFLHFNYVDLYLSTGTTVGLVEYPAGVSLKGDMLIFGKRAKFNCTVGRMIKIMATIEHFDLGPLTIKGASSPNAIVDIELSPSKQYVLIDGAVSIWGASVALHLDAMVFPNPAFDFWIDLRLSDLFRLQLRAQLSGDISFKDLKSLANADFQVYGLMEQHIVDYVFEQLEQQIDSAQQAAKHGFDYMKKDMDEKEAAFQAGCRKAIDELEDMRKAWHAKRDSVNAMFDKAHAEAMRMCKELQDKVDDAEKGFKQLIADLSRDLEQARADAAAIINEAEQDLNTAQRDSDNSIREAQEDLQRARDDFSRGFGSAAHDIENARCDVDNAQRRVDDLDNDIKWLDRRIDEGSWYEVPGFKAQQAGLEIAKAAANGSLEVTKGILYAAEAIVRGSGFIVAEGAIGAAQVALDGVREVKGAALDVARSALQEVRDAQNALIQGAIDALHEAQTASDELRLFELARDALAVGEGVAQGMISGAQAGVDALASCAEFAAFDLAEKGLEFAKTNTKELNLARHAVELAEGAVNLGLDVGKWAAAHGGKILNLRKIEFYGSVKSLIANGPPLWVKAEGVLMGEEFKVELQWQPHFDLMAFIRALFTELWEKIKDFAKGLIKDLTN